MNTKYLQFQNPDKILDTSLLLVLNLLSLSPIHALNFKTGITFTINSELVKKL